jgi:hypothetical protein
MTQFIGYAARRLPDHRFPDDRQEVSLQFSQRLMLELLELLDGQLVDRGRNIVGHPALTELRDVLQDLRGQA